MRLQSKKLNQPLLPPIIAGIFLLSFIYWLYLAHFTRMDIVYDSIEYRDLGRLLHTQGWIAYFKAGPLREPVYPFLVATSMAFEDCTGVAYVKIMAIFGVIILFITQVLTYKILRLLTIRQGICALVLAYLALSPALTNAAFSLYSEIAELPFVLSIVLTSYFAWEAIKRNNKQTAFIYGMLLGVSLTLATLVKDVFEGVSPVYLIIFFSTAFFTNRKVMAKKIMPLVLCIAAALSFYYAPISGYKWLNWHYNGNFALANRASSRLYCTASQREEPLTVKRLAEALAYVPGEGVCNSLFGAKECYFWSFQTADEMGKELALQHLPAKNIDAAVLHLSTQKILHNPFQYVLFTFVEGLKMFFWESTQIGFVQYPHWLQKIYDTKIINNALRFLLSLLTWMAMIHIWAKSFAPQKSPIAFLMGVLIFFYILFFAFFLIITRYMIPIAPLYLIAIGIWLEEILSTKKLN